MPSDPLNRDDIIALFPHMTIVAELPAGGQGVVFRAVHTVHGDVVLKVVSKAYSERGAREIEALRSVSHARILPLLEHGTVDIDGRPRPFTLTPFVTGERLRELVDAGPLAPDTVEGILDDVSLALEQLWMCRIVHRDINPKNIIIDAAGHAVVIDLGLVRCLDLETITTGLKGWGTPGYASPEQARGEHSLTVKSDIYSLGIVACEALTGHHPYHHDQDLITSAAAAPIISSAHPMGLGNLISTMLEPKAFLRPSPAEVRETLRRL